MFYELYCKGNNYHFVFTDKKGEVAVITLTEPLCCNTSVSLRRGVAWDQTIDADKRAIECLTAEHAVVDAGSDDDATGIHAGAFRGACLRCDLRSNAVWYGYRRLGHVCGVLSNKGLSPLLLIKNLVWFGPVD